MECIICRENKEEMSDEHVIPESLGGYYHIFSVCKKCNSDMGSSVDSPLINNKLTELYRFCQEITGKNGKIPNPFSGDFINANNQSSARFDVDSNGKLDPFTHPIIKIREEGNQIVGIEIEVDSKEESKIDQMLQKILKRKNIPDSAIIKGEKIRKIELGPYKAQWSMDTYKFKIGLLKIAYEFAVDSINDYFNDEYAIAISKVLRDADYQAVEHYMRGSGISHRAFDGFIDYFDFSSRKHYLILMNSPLGLSCLIKLHDLFSIGVVLSNKHYPIPQDIFLGVNDIDGKTFAKLGFNDALTKCLGPALTRFAYFFESEKERNESISEINSSNYRYEGNDNGEIPLYKRNGDKHPNMVHQLLEGCDMNHRVENGSVINFFEFDSTNEYYVKSLNSGNLHRVVAFEIEKKIINKI